MKSFRTFRLTNCKYLDCDHRMTLINIVSQRGNCTGIYTVKAPKIEEGLSFYRLLLSFLFRASPLFLLRLDSVKLWNNLLMSPPFWVVLMPTKLLVKITLLLLSAIILVFSLPPFISSSYSVPIEVRFHVFSTFVSMIVNLITLLLNVLCSREIWST